MSRPQDVSQTLDALERKLRELEGELGAPAPAPAPPPAAGAPVQAPPPAGLDDLARQIDDLTRFRDQLQRIGRELEDEYARVLARLEARPEAAREPEPEPAPEPVPVEPAPAEPAPEPAPTTAPGTITVDAGPFSDLDALGAFEQVLAGIAGVETVAVTGFEGRRAIVEARLGAPVALESELRDALPLPVVRAVSEPGRLVVDLAPGV
jgi:hypothetical protein